MSKTQQTYSPKKGKDGNLLCACSKDWPVWLLLSGKGNKVKCCSSPLVTNLICPLFLLFLLLACGCSNELPEIAPAGKFPDGTSLQSGDVVLARCPGFLPAVYASFGEPVSPYGHAAIYFINDRGEGNFLHIQPTGLQIASPNLFYHKYYCIALVRSLDPPAPKRINSVCRELWHSHLKKPIVGDFSNSGDENSMFCLALINLVYERAEGTIPFNRKWDACKDPMAAFLACLLKARDTQVTAVAGVLSNPQFSIISEWRDPDYDFRIEKIDDTLVDFCRRFVNDRYGNASAPGHQLDPHVRRFFQSTARCRWRSHRHR